MQAYTCGAEVAMKSISRIIPTTTNHWVGDGFYVKPVFNDMAFTKEISPFLMFDYAAPKEFAPSAKRRGVGVHPHRGFETVTIAFQGEVEHGDNQGNKDIIGPGDVQWMTAGKGIIHEEFISDRMTKSGGVLEMCQLWVNLPKKYKMTNPKYQAIFGKDIPSVSLSGDAGNVRIIAGSFDEITGAASTWSPVDMWDVNINPSKSFEFMVADGHNTLVFVRKGDPKVLDKTMKQESVALLSREGKRVKIDAEKDQPAKILILSGEPLDDPIAARGPFVMNTQEELRQAMIDYQSGKF